MKNILCAFFCSIAVVNCYAQQPPIMVCNAAGTSCTPYYNIDTAITYASPGSYIYLPGWNYALNAHITKELHIIGTGHYPDSTLVTGISTISNEVYIDTGGNNSSFEGLYCTNNIEWAHNYSASNINVTRCNLYGIIYSSFTHSCNDCLIKDCICRNGEQPSCINCTISNSIFGGTYGGIGLGYVSYSEINNCIFYGPFGIEYGGYTQNYLGNNTVKNNIFDSGYTSGFCANCILENNLTINSTLGIISASIESGTIANVPTSNLLVTPNTYGFSYSNNYNVLSTSPGHNAGTDGTDVGIYGSGNPWKSGSVPSNPHFFFKSVSNTTDSTGNLPVQFKVNAQY